MPPLDSYCDTFMELNSSCHSLDLEDLKPTTPSDEEQRSVSFSSLDLVVDIPHINDMAEEEIKDVWLSPDELEEIRSSCHRLVTFMNLTNNLTERGLEKHTDVIQNQKMALQSHVNELVLGIQEYQRLRGIVDPNQIAEHCRKYTAAALLEAHVMGLRDAVEVHCSDSYSSPRFT